MLVFEFAHNFFFVLFVNFISIFSYTLVMFFHLSQIYTTMHVIVMDTNQTPLNSTEKFKSCYERWLYDKIIDHMLSGTYHVRLLLILRTVLDFVKLQKSFHDNGTLVASVKYLVSNYVLANTETGNFQFEMLELGRAFDSDFIFHCNVLNKYDAKDIVYAINKSGGCDCKKFCKINKSLSYVITAICNYIYEMYKLQVKQNRLDRSENYYFQEYYGFVSNNTKYPLWSAYGDNIEIVTYHFAFADIFKDNLTKLEMEKWLLDHKSKTVHVHFYYSILEIHLALEDYKAKVKTNNSKKFYSVKTNKILENDINIKYLMDILLKASEMGIVKFYTRWERYISLYEIYHCTNELSPDTFKAFIWTKKLLQYNRCVNANKKLYNDKWGELPQFIQLPN